MCRIVAVKCAVYLPGCPLGDGSDIGQPSLCGNGLLYQSCLDTGQRPGSETKERIIKIYIVFCCSAASRKLPFTTG